MSDARGLDALLAEVEHLNTRIAFLNSQSARNEDVTKLVNTRRLLAERREIYMSLVGIIITWCTIAVQIYIYTLQGDASTTDIVFKALQVIVNAVAFVLGCAEIVRSRRGGAMSTFEKSNALRYFVALSAVLSLTHFAYLQKYPKEKKGAREVETSKFMSRVDDVWEWVLAHRPQLIVSLFIISSVSKMAPIWTLPFRTVPRTIRSKFVAPPIIARKKEYGPSEL